MLTFEDEDEEEIVDTDAGAAVLLGGVLLALTTDAKEEELRTDGATDAELTTDAITGTIAATLRTAVTVTVLTEAT